MFILLLSATVVKAENKVFNIVANQMGYNESLRSLIKGICEAESSQKKLSKLDCIKKTNVVYEKVKQTMEIEFLKKIKNKEEQAYLEKLFAYDLMKRLFEFKNDFIGDPKTNSSIVDALKK